MVLDILVAGCTLGTDDMRPVTSVAASLPQWEAMISNNSGRCAVHCRGDQTERASCRLMLAVQVVSRRVCAVHIGTDLSEKAECR
jgi:hypothetical protein